MVALSTLLGRGAGDWDMTVLGGAVPLGSSYATGTASATIVTAGANTNGVLICTLSFHATVSNAILSLKIDGGIVYECHGLGPGWLSGLLVPAGVSVAVEKSGAGSNTLPYHITYEVL